MKWEEGVLRLDRMDGMGWCVDMGYQRFPVLEGMAISVRICDHFERGQVLGVADDSLAMEFGSRLKWPCTLRKNERFAARLTTRDVETMLEEALAEELRYVTPATPHECCRRDDDDLCF